MAKDFQHWFGGAGVGSSSFTYVFLKKIGFYAFVSIFMQTIVWNSDFNNWRNFHYLPLFLFLGLRESVRLYCVILYTIPNTLVPFRKWNILWLCLFMWTFITVHLQLIWNALNLERVTYALQTRYRSFPCIYRQILTRYTCYTRYTVLKVIFKLILLCCNTCNACNALSFDLVSSYITCNACVTRV